jgi:radical SAM superfamily enzyme YgiQ (UPF0313 family)
MTPIRKVLLAQLPIPQLSYPKRTGNIPLAAACLKQAAETASRSAVEILPERAAAYLGDAALVDAVIAREPDVVGFTVFSWNVMRSLHIAGELRRRRPVRILFGGPEVTPDNPLVRSPAVDFRAYGDGEALFQRLLRDPSAWARKEGAEDAEALFLAAPSPYVAGYLDPAIEAVMFIETQRGCPYRCGYCFYGKNRRRIAAVPAETVLEGVRWARDRGVPEVFLLDPSLNARAGLRGLLDEIAGINRGRRIAFQSEIRAEAVDRGLAKRFARAGFAEFEIGLQTTTPEALRLMNRPMDLERFLAGVGHLGEAGIRPKIDLILGLPGDTPDGFRRSVDFVAENGLADDVQVFFLSVLPGTPFRRAHRALGLVFDPRPPYTVRETPAFSPGALADAWIYAEDAFDISLSPGPDLDLAYRGNPAPGTHPACRRVSGMTTFSDGAGIFKVILDGTCASDRLARISRRLTHPYQVFFLPGSGGRRSMAEVLGIVTRANPHTPIEIVFFDPADPSRLAAEADAVERSLGLHRPLYLDLDLPAFGSRSVMLTLVCREPVRRFSGPMRRQVLRWSAPGMPDKAQLDTLDFLDGILMDNTLPAAAWTAWQDAFWPLADDMLRVSFADIGLQRRWRDLTAPGEYLPDR